MLYGVADIGRNMIGLGSHSGRLREGEFWALENVSLEVEKGETLGVIGPNGSGKTTLMKLLNGIFWPDKGRVTVKGKVGALIAVGAGFHPSLTGRENIYINGAILGMGKRDIDKRIESIIDFADIGNFLDAPVKHYSSGMFVRLGFSVAAHCKPDILLVDEVLAVGDVDFQNKCYRKFKEFKDSGITIIFVSHSLDIVRRICTNVLLLNSGEIKAYGDREMCLSEYQQLLAEKNLRAGSNGSVFDQEAKILGIHLLDRDGVEKEAFELKEKLMIRIEYTAFKKIENPCFTIAFYGQDGQCHVGHTTYHDRYIVAYIDGYGVMDIEFEGLYMKPGLYTISVGIWNNLGISPYAWHQRVYHIILKEDRRFGNGIHYLPHQWNIR